MSRVTTPDHLSRLPTDPAAYEALYAMIRDVDRLSFAETPWQERRIPPGLTAAQVYRRLPAAPDFEYGGYLTATRVRYRRCWEGRADFDASRPATFHSHATGHRHADLPSDRDVYAFLRYRHLRSVTVGASLIWWFDKTPATLGTVRRLNAWEGAHMIEALAKGTFQGYASVALGALGLRWPRSVRRLEREWPVVLRQALHIRVTVVPRDG